MFANLIRWQIGSPRFEFVRQGVNHGPVTITMPDGEVLNGRYQVIQGGAVTLRSASAFRTSGSAFASGSSLALSGAALC